MYEPLLVQQAIDTHNSTYGKNFSIQDRADEVYPDLRGRLNWDWVCKDQASGVEAAVEVKRLTSELAEETHANLGKIGREVIGKAQARLLGVFNLHVDLPGPDFQVGGPARRKKLVDRIAGFVVGNAKEVPHGQAITTRVEVGGQLSEVLPTGTRLDLYRHDPARLKLAARQLNYLHINFGWGMFGATGTLMGEELAEFRRVIGKANRQLGIAKQMMIRETLLVLIEIGFSAADPSALESTVRSLTREEYDNINHIYLVGYPAARRIGGIASPPSPESASP